MGRYQVKMEQDGSRKYYYICNTDSMDIELYPSKYLTHKVRAKQSPNTVRRAALALTYYLQFMDMKEMGLTDVYQLGFEQQYKHFTDFLDWLKQGQHKEHHEKIPHNGTCNAYLQDVFRFYLFMEQDEWRGKDLLVLSYNQIVTADSVGVKKVLRSQAFKGYLKAEERNVRAAGKDEITMLLEACTNCRDQALILLMAETGFRIGEILGIDYIHDIDYKNHLVKVSFREDNENNARAKNAEYRRAKVSDSTFDFLLYYISEYRHLIQKQRHLFITIAGSTAGQPMNVDAVYDMLERMEKNLEVQRQLTGRFSMTEYVTLNRDFHWEILQAADNEYIEKFCHELFNKSAIFLIFYDQTGTNQESIRTHDALLRALRERDAEAAVEATKADIVCAADCLSFL